MSNDISNEILIKLSSIESSISITTNTFLIFVGALVAIFVCYLMYKLIDNFISF